MLILIFSLQYCFLLNILVFNLSIYSIFIYYYLFMKSSLGDVVQGRINTHHYLLTKCEEERGKKEGKKEGKKDGGKKREKRGEKKRGKKRGEKKKKTKHTLVTYDMKCHSTFFPLT